MMRCSDFIRQPLRTTPTSNNSNAQEARQKNGVDIIADALILAMELTVMGTCGQIHLLFGSRQSSKSLCYSSTDVINLS